MNINYALPSAADLRTYLKVMGWDEMASGPSGGIWGNDAMKIGVPHDDDEYLIRATIDRVAAYEKRSPKDIAIAVRYLHFDVTHLRAAHDYRITDTIPLNSATKILTSTKAMLRATATTARRERAHIDNNFSRRGDEVVKEALMGHTERGSFVIPILVPIPDPPEPEQDQTSLEQENAEALRVPQEPFPRRVTRTFAQSMQAVHDIIVEPARDPTTDQLHELVYSGVSREFCSALAGILAERSVAEFGSSINWAPAIAAPGSTARDIAIDAGAVELVQRVAKKLQRQKVDPKQIWTGPIIQLRHESLSDPFGEISISIVRRGRPSEIIVRLPIARYREAWDWHYAGRTVLVEGVAERSPGKPLRISNPRRCHPMDELFLSEQRRSDHTD